MPPDSLALLERFYRDLLYELGEHAQRGGTAVGAAVTARRVARGYGLSVAERLPLPRLDRRPQVHRIFDVSIDGAGLNGIALGESAVEVPYVKDYDAIMGEGPTRWPRQFDTTNWGLLAAYDNARRVGGALIAFNTEDLWMLQGRTDLTALWDLRVRPEMRGKGVGTALFHAAEDWSRRRESVQLKIETQNVNVVACRFYVAMGCTLGGINQYAYADMPDETQLLWFKDL